MRALRNFVITRWQRAVEGKPILGELLASVGRTTTFFLFMIALFVSAMRLNLDPGVERFVRNLTMIALIVQAAIWLSYFLRAWIFDYLARKTKRDEASLGALSIFNFLGQTLVWSLALLFLLRNLGIDVTALVTGLGIGGVAVALALQRVLGDILSSLSIVLDKPFVAGDFIVFGEHMGTIEQIGVKTTRIRSLGGEQIICPNSDLLNTHMDIQQSINLAIFERFRREGIDFACPTPTQRLYLEDIDVSGGPEPRSRAKEPTTVRLLLKEARPT